MGNNFLLKVLQFLLPDSFIAFEMAFNTVKTSLDANKEASFDQGASMDMVFT